MSDLKAQGLALLSTMGAPVATLLEGVAEDVALAYNKHCEEPK